MSKNGCGFWILCWFVLGVLPMTRSESGECRIDDRPVPCAAVERCMLEEGVLQVRNGKLLCCYADGRCKPEPRKSSPPDTGRPN